jgi:hypothetical protein
MFIPSPHSGNPEREKGNTPETRAYRIVGRGDFHPLIPGRRAIERAPQILGGILVGDEGMRGLLAR